MPLLTYSLHFSATAWSQIGSLDSVRFDSLQRALQECAERAAAWLALPGYPTVEPCVPIAVPGIVAECAIDDHRRTVTVERVEPL